MEKAHKMVLRPRADPPKKKATIKKRNVPKKQRKHIGYSMGCLSTQPCQHSIVVLSKTEDPVLTFVMGDKAALLYIEHGYRVPNHFREYIPPDLVEKEKANTFVISGKTKLPIRIPKKQQGQFASEDVRKQVWDLKHGFVF